MLSLERVHRWARRTRRDALALWFAYRLPDTPRWVKGLCAFVIGYAASPVDVNPDFIPVLGYVDDTLLIAGFVWLAMRLLPRHLVDTSRRKADAWLARQPRNSTAFCY